MTIGHAFKSKIYDQYYLTRCFECGRENYLPAVASGVCAWCGYDLNQDEQIKAKINANPLGELTMEVKKK